MGSCGHLRPPGPRRKSRRFAPSSCAGSPHSPSQRVWIPPCACRPHRPPTWPSARGGSLFDMSTVAHTPADLIIRYLPFGQPNEHAPRQYTGVYGRRLAPGESLLVPRTGRPYPGFGPGGRAVHKANSNVEVRLPLDKVAWLPKYVAHNIRRMEPLRVNGSFELVVFSNHGYFQATNFHKCLEEIVRIVKAAAILPDWEGDATRSTIGLHAQVDNERRLRGKKRRSEIKAARRLIADR
ncbi:hypothetical protein, variant 1 [Fonticula alba]|uniref:Uncharacterized protein n=1 Tax=Fonticula alba TaxID=691883 RepID=A0A058Z4M9_FONAL|nr:hypothetical protein, variant 1 [Fonticula alba]KCV69071.1 hypothetical protein, variant 1 [Fonticula alba]|eukprot:XP_009496642.1 hypothetical protein, variant 1 [Fonticula alba]